MPSQPKVSIELLPPLLRDFERLIGLRATMALVQGWGGLRIYFPTPDRITVDHPYAKAIGLEAVKTLCKEYGGLPHFQLPKAERALLAVRNARIAEDYTTRKTARELAMEYGLTERQVARLIGSMGISAPKERRQKSLF